MNKKELQETIKIQKERIAPQTKALKSKAILERVKETDVFRQATTILCYWSIEDEVTTHDFIIETAQYKQIYLPVISGDKLLIRRFTSLESMQKGASYSILEPNERTEETDIEHVDLVIVPGIAFDTAGGRLGRGKGFYDKLLGGSHAYKLGVCFDFQITEVVPREEHDILMDNVIYE